jgi:translation initiation factor 1 (eIF-1/SUI1)
MHTQFYRSNKKSAKIISIPDQEQWRDAKLIRWIEFFDEINQDLAGILASLRELIKAGNFPEDDYGIMFEHARHLAFLIAETRGKLP